MYAIKSQSGATWVFINKQSCETFMRDGKKKPKETLMEYKARLKKLVYFNPHSHNSY